MNVVSAYNKHRAITVVADIDVSCHELCFYLLYEGHLCQYSFLHWGRHMCKMPDTTTWDGEVPHAEYVVHHGVWTNWSRDLIMGATLTVSHRWKLSPCIYCLVHYLGLDQNFTHQAPDLSSQYPEISEDHTKGRGRSLQVAP